MNSIKRSLLSVFLLLSALFMLAGCGGISYEIKARGIALDYINKKYGFSAEVTYITFPKNDWLEFSWETPSFADVSMKHGECEFDVFVPIRQESSFEVCDNYEADSICAEIGNYLRDCLKCDNISFRADYGNGYGNHLLPVDIRSADDLKKSSYDKTISVYTYGLDAENVRLPDPAVYGEKTNFSIVEWRDENLPEVPYGLIRTLPSDCGWDVSAIHYTNNDGSWTDMPFDRIVLDNVCLVMPEECCVTMEPADGPENEGDVPMTEWYCIKGSGEGYGVLYASVGAAPDDEYCVEYEHKGKAYYERMPHTENNDSRYELCAHRYCSGKEDDVFVFRVVKRDFYKDSK